MDNKERPLSEQNEEELLKIFTQKLMGRSLDLARVSGMSDRSFDQFKKSLKDDHYSTLENFLKLFAELKNLNSQR
jgi:hypothetical protein